MARLVGEIWADLLKWDIAPWWQYVPSKLNVADISSRADKVHLERVFVRKYSWRPRSAESQFLPLARLLRQRPEVAWGVLHSRLCGWRRDSAQ